MNTNKIRYPDELRNRVIWHVLDASVPLSRSAAALRYDVPTQRVSEWINAELERRAEHYDPCEGRGRVDPFFLEDLRARLEERDRRNAVTPAFDARGSGPMRAFGIHMLGDPPPGRSALDQRAAVS